MSGTRTSSAAWIEAFNTSKGRKLFTSTKRIIVAPPLYLLSLMADQIAKYGLPIAIASQDLDPQAEILYSDPEKGMKHTGQGHVPAHIADCANYIILGHPETRTRKKLTNDDVNKRLDIARKYDLLPIVCVTNIGQAAAITRHDSQFAGIIAYEPLENIGTVAADPTKANKVCRQITKLYPRAQVMYGGSVNPKNIHSFLTQDSISGVLVGDKSSNADFFQDIIRRRLPKMLN